MLHIDGFSLLVGLGEAEGCRLHLVQKRQQNHGRQREQFFQRLVVRRGTFGCGQQAGVRPGEHGMPS